LSKATKALKGSFILVLTKLSEKLLGLISTLVLARLLLPEDFGIVAISLLVMMFVEMISATGSNQYIIQKENVNDDDINTAWTINIILKSCVFILLLVISPLVAEYYDDNRLTMVIPILSTILITGAFSNPHLIMLQREQNYTPILKMDIIKKVCSISVMIAVAFTFKNYWALIAGHFVSSLVKSICSYIMLSYRPKFCLKNIKPQWDFSKWMLSKGILGYTRSQLDTFFVSSFYSPAQLGGFHVSKYIATMPATEGVSPALEPLLASFSRNKKDKDSLAHQVKLALLTTFLVTIPLTSFIFIFSYQIVELLLGEKWIQFHDMFAALSLLGVSLAIGSLSGQLITSLGKVKSLFYYDLISLCLMATAMFLNKDNSLLDFIFVRILMEWVIVISLLLYATSSLKIINYKLILMTLIKITGAVVIGYITYYFHFFSLPLFISLSISTVIYSLLWCLFVTLLYYSYYKKLPEGAHIQFIITSLIKSIKK
jgi:lipopolysaccharide exporter